VARLKWTPKAQSHLQSIYSYISRDSEIYAKKFIERLIITIEKIPIFPEMGRVVPELAEYNLREVIFQNYRIVYRYLRNEHEVQILSIVHGARDMRKIPAEEWRD